MRLLEFFRPFRCVITRRVSEEEQVSVELFARNTDIAQIELVHFLSIFRDHRKRTNEEVVAVTRQQVAALDTHIAQRQGQIAELDEQIAKQHAELRRLDGYLKDKRRRLEGKSTTVSPIANGRDIPDEKA